MKTSLLLPAALMAFCLPGFALAIAEEDRVREYHKRGYTWPITDYQPNTTGWRELMEDRFHQIEDIESRGERYEAFIQNMRSAVVVPNYTEHGFGMARCPDDLLAALQEGIRDGLAQNKQRHEHTIEVIDAPNKSWFISRPDLTKRVLHELKHYAETWASIPLTPHTAYGFRLYRNDSRLNMHVDKVETHIVSFILHIDSSEDAEPWPIYIEDYSGNSHEVILTPGDILFYESSKCWHGRPKRFNGSWYTSVFVHYYPRGWKDRKMMMESHYAVPPGWNKPPNPATPRHPTKLQMVGTSMTEPDCPHEWCRSETSKKWSGPGEAGYLIAPTGEKVPFHPKEVDYNDEL